MKNQTKNQEQSPRGRRDAKGRPMLVAKPFVAKGTAAYRIVERHDRKPEWGDDRG